jgi:hypothetical protein
VVGVAFGTSLLAAGSAMQADPNIVMRCARSDALTLAEPDRGKIS